MKRIFIFFLIIFSSIALVACGQTDDTVRNEDESESSLSNESSYATSETGTNLADYEINGSILVKYTGAGGSVAVPDAVLKIGDNAFNNSEVTDVTLPTGIIDIGERAFADCSKLSEINIPDSLISIGNLAFANCPSLSKITLPDSLVDIGEYAFADCSGLSEINFPDGLKNIGRLAFANTALEQAVFPDGLKEIGELAFYRCSSLRYIRFPESSVIMEARAFNGCTALQHIDNCLDEEWNSRIEVNEQVINNHLNPSDYISSQSQRITELEEEITNGIKSDYESAYAISKWLEDNIAVDDYKSEGRSYDSVALEPEDVLNKGKTVCEGYARLTQALLRARGIPALHVIGYLDGGLHAWNIAYIDEHWLWMDNMYGTRWFDASTIGLSADYLSTEIKFSLDNSVPISKLYDQSGEAVSVSIDPAKWEGNYNYNWESVLANSGNGNLEISNQSPNHAMITQVVSVKPNRDYTFSASVRLENFQPSENNSGGACINVANSEMSVTADEPRFITSSDWTTSTISFNSGNMTSVCLCLSNGWYDDLSMGTAYFKDITLIETGTNGIVPAFE